MSETFLNRWARRKAEARQHDEEPEAEAAVTPEEQVEAADPVEADEPPDEETKQRWIAELEQVDIDALTYDDDFAVYMKDWVPAGLRQKALRKLWTSHPTLACLDGLNDYEEDFTDAGTVVANMKSDWLPGSGYKVLDGLGADATPSDQAPADAAPAEDDAPEAPAADEALVAEADDGGEPRAAAESAADDDEEPDAGAPDKTA